jgi:ABC-type amino acid transport substrate-binding protein
MDRQQRTHLRPGSSLAVALVAAAWAAAAAAAPAADRTVSVGLFAPAAPFSGPIPRLEFVSQLASHLAAALGAAKGTGRVYANAADFVSAARTGAIQYGVIDSNYAASRGLPYRILATAVRGGATSASWVLLSSSPVGSISELRGRRLAVPRMGPRIKQFVSSVLLDHELSADFFGGVIAAPDSLSAIAAVSVGRADAAFVPDGLPVPAGISRVATVAEIGWPVFVALPAADPAEANRAAAAATSFVGRAAFSGFSRDGLTVHRALVRRFGKRRRRAPIVTSPPHFALKEVVGDRSFALPQIDLALWAEPRPSGAGGAADGKQTTPSDPAAPRGPAAP